MNSLFAVGDQVVSKTHYQGLEVGAKYTVKIVEQQPTAFGTFVTYVVEGSDGKLRAVSNGHMVLDPVKQELPVGVKITVLKRRR